MRWWTYHVCSQFHPSIVCFVVYFIFVLVNAGIYISS